MAGSGIVNYFGRLPSLLGRAVNSKTYGFISTLVPAANHVLRFVRALAKDIKALARSRGGAVVFNLAVSGVSAVAVNIKVLATVFAIKWGLGSRWKRISGLGWTLVESAAGAASFKTTNSKGIKLLAVIRRDAVALHFAATLVKAFAMCIESLALRSAGNKVGLSGMDEEDSEYQREGQIFHTHRLT